jgi:cytochrome c-type biogenesis protein CcmH/NrfF
VIENAVRKGLTEEQIVEIYVKTYGADILALAEDSPLAVMSWSVPYALISLGLALVVLIALRLRKKPLPAPGIDVSAADRQALDRALEDLD